MAMLSSAIPDFVRRSHLLSLHCTACERQGIEEQFTLALTSTGLPPSARVAGGVFISKQPEI
jgi:hypothetical protein